MHASSGCFLFFPTVGILIFFIVAFPVVTQWWLTVVLLCTALKTNDMKHLSRVYWSFIHLLLWSVCSNHLLLVLLDCFIIPISPVRKLKLREVTKSASGHTAPRALNLGLLDLIQSFVHSVMPSSCPSKLKELFYNKSLGIILVNQEDTVEGVLKTEEV